MRLKGLRICLPRVLRLLMLRVILVRSFLRLIGRLRVGKLILVALLYRLSSLRMWILRRCRVLRLCLFVRLVFVSEAAEVDV